MTSLSTVTAGIKAPSALLPNRTFYALNNVSGMDYLVGAIEVAYTGGSGVQTVLNVSGSGVIQWCCFGADAVTTSATMTIDIDGTQVLNESRGNIYDAGIMGIGSWELDGSRNAFAFDWVPFYSSFVVTVSCNTNATFGYIYYST